MIAGLKPYSEYKESGLPWLGKVPGHWSVERLRQVTDMLVSNVDKHTKADELPVRLCNYVDVYKNERITERLPFMRATATRDEIRRFRLRVGDAILTKDSEVWTDIGVPALAEYAAPDLVCGYHLAILRPREGVLTGTYLLRVLQSEGVAAQFHVSAHGVTRYGLSHAGIKSVAVPLPPPDEQSAIVRFLDYANGRLEKAIRAKRKTIALLNEQKQAIIHRAVTRGLDPNVRLKDSGMPWLGEIPEHWEVIRLKNVLSRPLANGLFKRSESFGSGTPIVNVRDIYRDGFEIAVHGLEKVRATDEEIQRFRVLCGDLFFVRSSLKLEGTGRSAFISECPQGTVFECHLVQARPHRERTIPRYVAMFLNSWYSRNNIISRANTVTMSTMPQGVINSLGACPTIHLRQAFVAPASMVGWA